MFTDPFVGAILEIVEFASAKWSDPMEKASEYERITDPVAILERALIEEFILARGYDPAQLHELPDDQRRLLLIAASRQACARLAEMEARAHYLHELHGER